MPRRRHQQGGPARGLAALCSGAGLGCWGACAGRERCMAWLAVWVSRQVVRWTAGYGQKEERRPKQTKAELHPHRCAGSKAEVAAHPLRCHECWAAGPRPLPQRCQAARNRARKGQREDERGNKWVAAGCRWRGLVAGASAGHQRPRRGEASHHGHGCIILPALLRVGEAGAGGCGAWCR